MTDKEKKFLADAKQVFDQSLSELDAGTAEKLTQARQQALSRQPKHNRRWLAWSAVPAAGLAAVLVVIFFWPVQQAPLQGNYVADLEVISSDEALDFYEEIEFYQWLSEVAENEKELSRLDGVGPFAAAGVAGSCSGTADASRRTEQRNARVSRLI